MFVESSSYVKKVLSVGLIGLLLSEDVPNTFLSEREHSVNWDFQLLFRQKIQQLVLNFLNLNHSDELKRKNDEFKVRNDAKQSCQQTNILPTKLGL